MVVVIFVERKIQEKCCEPNYSLCVAFSDVRRAFDMVNQSSLTFLHQLHKEMHVRVRIGANLFKPLISNEVK